MSTCKRCGMMVEYYPAGVLRTALNLKIKEDISMSEIDKSKSKRGTLLVWVTNPEAAGRIVSSAKLFASDKSLDLKVVSVQRETRDNWADTIRDLERLQAAASGSQAELTVVYSDDRIEAAKKLVRSEKPMAMFAGRPDKGSTNFFVEALSIEFPSVTLYSVDSRGEVEKYVREQIR